MQQGIVDTNILTLNFVFQKQEHSLTFNAFLKNMES